MVVKNILINFELDLTLIIIIAIISTAIFAFASLFGKYLIQEIGNFYHFVLLQFVFQFLILLLVNIALGIKIEFIFNVVFFNPQLIIGIISASLFAFGGFFTLFKGFEVGNVSVGGVYLSSRVFISVPIAFVFLGETFSFITYFWIIILVLGAFMVSWEKSLSVKQVLSLKANGANYFVLTLIFWGLSNSIISTIIDEIDPLSFLLIRGFIFLTLALITFPTFNKLLGQNRRVRYTNKTIKYTLLYGIIIVIAQNGFIFALGQSLTLAEGIGVLEGIFTFVFAIFVTKYSNIGKFLDEPTDRLTLLVRITGVLIALFATIGVLIEVGNL